MLRPLLIWTLLLTTSLAQDVSIQPVPSDTPSAEPSPEPIPPSAEPTNEPITTPSDTPSTPPDIPPSTIISDTPSPGPTDTVITDSGTTSAPAPTGSVSVSGSGPGDGSVSESGSVSVSDTISSIASGSVSGSAAPPPASGTSTLSALTSIVNPEATVLSESASALASSSPPSSLPSSSAPPPASSATGQSVSGAGINPSASAASGTNTAAGSAVTGSGVAPTETRIPLINVEATDTSVATSTINSASTSIPTTPVIAATARSYPLDQGDDNFVVAQDTINLPERFLSDEIVSTLTYTANYDKNLCETKAQQYSTRASQSLLSHWSFLLHRRQTTQSTSLCLPALYEIPTTVHWVLPANADRGKWVNWDAWNYQITQTRNQLQQLNVALNLAPFRFYQDSNSDRMTNRPKAPENLDFAKGWVAAAKEASGSTAYNHLNIFIVEKPNDDSLGYSNYPGATAESYYPDAVIIGAASLPGNTQLLDGANVGDQDGREGTTLAHEIGHWLGLLHLHEGGCSGTDGIATTPQYASGSDYSKTCLGEDKGPDGIYEHNLMSASLRVHSGVRGQADSQFAAGRTVKSAFFNQEQMVRAAVGYFLRRNGLSSATIESQWLKLCPEQARNVTRRALPLFDTSSHLPLTRRQMSNELSRYCQNSDLTVPDYEFSSLASAGLFNPNSPTIPQSPGIVIPQSVSVGAAEAGASDRAGSNFGDLDNRVNAQIAQTGAITSPDTTPIDSPEPAPRNGAGRSIASGGGTGTLLLALVSSVLWVVL